MQQYIIYLHPKQGSIGFDQMTKFWNNGKDVIQSNLAFNYPFHSTLVSFFKTNHPEKVAEEAKKIFGKISAVAGEIFHGDGGTFNAIDVNSHDLDSAIKILTDKFDFIKSDVIGKLHITLTHKINKNSASVASTIIENNIDTTKWTDEWSVIMWCRQEGIWSIFQCYYLK